MSKEGYADWMWEMWREQKGLKPDDESKDEEILKEQKKGKKISKSDMNHNLEGYTPYFNGHIYRVKEIKVGDKSKYPIYKTELEAEKYAELLNNNEDVIGFGEEIASKEELVKYLFKFWDDYTYVTSPRKDILVNKIKDLFDIEVE